MVRRISVIALGLLLVLALGACGKQEAAPAAGSKAASGASAQSFQGQSLKVATWGGFFAEYVKKYIGDPLEKATGAKVEYTMGNPRDHLVKLLATKGQEPPYDIVLLDDATQEQAIRDGVLVKLDFAKIPTIKEIFKEAITADGYGPGFYMTSIGIVYNSKKYEELGLKAPATIADLFDAKLKGRVAIPDMNVAMGPFALIAASFLAGGDDVNLQPGIDKLAQLQPYLYKDSTDLATRLTNGDMWAGWWIDGQVRTLAPKGVPVKFVRPKIGDKYEGMSNFGMPNIVQGSKRVDLGLQFMNIMYGKTAQIGMGVEGGYNPVSVAAAEEVTKDPKFKSEYVADPKQVAKVYRMNNNRLNTGFAKWMDQWNRAMRK